MSDWMLYHVWRIRCYKAHHCERVEPHSVIVTITPTRQTLRCPGCHSRDVIRKGVNLRLLRGAPVGRMRTGCSMWTTGRSHPARHVIDEISLEPRH